MSFEVDASGRKRVSQINTLFDGKTLNEDNPNYWDNVGTGTGTFANNKYEMQVDAGEYVIRQSVRYMPYFSGKSQLIEMTCDDFSAQNGVAKRLGYFSSGTTSSYTTNIDGFFLEASDGTYYLKAYRKGTLTHSVEFTMWDGYETLKNYNWNAFTVVAFDFLWLGGATLRMFVKTDDGFILAHTIIHAGSQSDLFILSPQQPVRYEIRSTTGTGSMFAICSQVATEGSTDEAGRPITHCNTAFVTTNVVGTVYALLGVKIRSDRRDTAVRIFETEIVNSSGTDQGQILILKNPTIAGSFTYADKTGTAVQVATGTSSNTVSDLGTEIINHAATTSLVTTALSSYYTWLTINADNEADSYVFAYRVLSLNQTVAATLELKEY